MHMWHEMRFLLQNAELQVNSKNYCIFSFNINFARLDVFVCVCVRARACVCVCVCVCACVCGRSIYSRHTFTNNNDNNARVPAIQSYSEVKGQDKVRDSILPEPSGLVSVPASAACHTAR